MNNENGRPSAVDALLDRMQHEPVPVPVESRLLLTGCTNFGSGWQPIGSRPVGSLVQSACQIHSQEHLGPGDGWARGSVAVGRVRRHVGRPQRLGPGQTGGAFETLDPQHVARPE